jgi:carboxymethylenebutenolidase
VLGLYGAKDGGIPQTQIDAMKGVLPKTGISGEFVVYPEAGHGFHADYRPSYRADDAADGVKRLVAHFAKNGVKA